MDFICRGHFSFRKNPRASRSLSSFQRPIAVDGVTAEGMDLYGSHPEVSTSIRTISGRLAPVLAMHLNN